VREVSVPFPVAVTVPDLDRLDLRHLEAKQPPDQENDQNDHDDGGKRLNRPWKRVKRGGLAFGSEDGQEQRCIHEIRLLILKKFTTEITEPTEIFWGVLQKKLRALCDLCGENFNL
jgi:hypothetical protein